MRFLYVFFFVCVTLRRYRKGAAVMKGNEEDEVFMPNANVIRERRHKQIELYGTMIFLWIEGDGG